jgi:hypothetical protein
MEEQTVTDKCYTYKPPEDEMDVSLQEDWEYPDINDDCAVERFIEERRTAFREEWFQYLEENGYYD